VVGDTGRGFDAETLRRVFEPYFTTRADGGGTGLGMAIAKRIAVEHGGTLTASGAPGRGATITLTVPVNGPSPELA
jgi:signal transduction histidine kinase